MRKVVITGAGSVNALGFGCEAYLAGLRAGRVGIGAVTLFDTSGYRSKRAAEVSRLTPPPWLPAGVARHASRSDLLALIAADEALRAAGLRGSEIEDLAPPLLARAAVALGATTGGMLGGEAYVEQMHGDGAKAAPRRKASLLPATPAYSTVPLLSQMFGCYGPRGTISTACSSGANALGLAADWIRSGRAPLVLCGGADSLCRMTFSGFNALQALDSEVCRPFDKRRAGLSLGEAAAMFVFEDAEHAAQRGATVWAEFLGYGVSADAHHITQPRPDGAGALLSMQRALRDSGVSAEEIDYVNAHGTATPLNDVIETRALRALLGGRAEKVPVSSTKSMIGHCLGAAGAAEALASVLALQHQFVPPTASLEEADPECDLDYVARHSRDDSLSTVLSCSYGFGGNNTSLILRRADA